MYSSLLLHSSSTDFLFPLCILLNINFTMKIIKNASPAISSYINNKKKTTFHWMLRSIHIYYESSMFVFMAVWWLMCIYIYACFVVLRVKNIIYTFRSWNWSVTLWNFVYVKRINLTRCCPPQTFTTRRIYTFLRSSIVFGDLL